MQDAILNPFSFISVFKNLSDFNVLLIVFKYRNSPSSWLQYWLSCLPLGHIMYNILIILLVYLSYLGTFFGSLFVFFLYFRLPQVWIWLPKSLDIVFNLFSDLCFWINTKYHVFAPMGRFQFKINLPLFSTVVPSNMCFCPVMLRTGQKHTYIRWDDGGKWR